MSERRDFIGYLGSGAVGVIIGYYTGAQELLGIQTSPQDATPGNSPSTATPTDTTAEQSSSRELMFRDEFDDGEFTDTWDYIEGQRADGNEISESGTVLRHEAAANYDSNSPIRTKQSVEASGTHRIVIRARTHTADYNGWGFSIDGQNTSIALKNHKWEGFDRLAVLGVSNRSDEYASDYQQYGEQEHKAKLAPATAQTVFLRHSLTVDFDTNTITEVTRGEEAWQVSFDIDDVGNSYQLRLPTGGGHDVEYDSISVNNVTES